MLFIPILTTAQETNCLAFQGRDGKFKKDRLDTKAELLFAYTSEQTKAYFPDKDLIKTNASLTYIDGGYYFLNFVIDIALANAPTAYGSIPTRSNITIYFLDGSKANLRRGGKTIGVFQKAETVYRYEAQYPIGGTTLKKLKEKELDKISLTWTTGIEEYEIYDVDFFVRHFECLTQYQ